MKAPSKHAGISLRLNEEAEIALRVLRLENPDATITEIVQGLIIDRGGDVRSRWARDARAAGGEYGPGQRQLMNEAQRLLYRSPE